MKKILFIFLLIISLLIFYFSKHSERIQQNEEIFSNLYDVFILKINQTAFIKSENLKIKFVNVIEDSRCPVDVVCVWAGRVVVLLSISKDNKYFEDFELSYSISQKEQDKKIFDGYSIKFIRIEPEKFSKQKISEYFAYFSVSKI